MDMSSLPQQPMVLIPFDQYMKLIKTNENGQKTTNESKSCSISTQTSISNKSTTSSVENKNGLKNASSSILLKKSSTSSSSVTTLLKNDSSKKAMNTKECRLIVTCVSSTKSSDTAPTTTTTTMTSSTQKRKRSPSQNTLNLPSNKEPPILNDMRLAHYTKVILNTATILPSQDAEEVKRRVEYAKYSLEWRLYRAIDLARMDLEQKFVFYEEEQCFLKSTSTGHDSPVQQRCVTTAPANTHHDQATMMVHSVYSFDHIKVQQLQRQWQQRQQKEQQQQRQEVQLDWEERELKEQDEFERIIEEDLSNQLAEMLREEEEQSEWMQKQLKQFETKPELEALKQLEEEEEQQKQHTFLEELKQLEQWVHKEQPHRIRQMEYYQQQSNQQQDSILKKLFNRNKGRSRLNIPSNQKGN